MERCSLPGSRIAATTRHLHHAHGERQQLEHAGARDYEHGRRFQSEPHAGCKWNFPPDLVPLDGSFRGNIRYNSSTDGKTWNPTAEVQVTTVNAVDDWVPTIAQAPDGSLAITS
jgi:hypothetical protein